VFKKQHVYTDLNVLFYDYIFYPNIFGMLQVGRFWTTALSYDKVYFCFLFSVLIGFGCFKKESDHHRIFWHYCWSCCALQQFKLSTLPVIQARNMLTQTFLYYAAFCNIL